MVKEKNKRKWSEDFFSVSTLREIGYSEKKGEGKTGVSVVEKETGFREGGVDTGLW